jgi:type VI protein secretion system component VasF
MAVGTDIVLLEFERLFAQWLRIKAELDEQLRELYAQTERDQPDLCLLRAQKALVKTLQDTPPSDVSLSRMDLANLEKLRFALAAYWDDFLLQRHDWIGLPEAEQQQLRKTWLKYLVEWETFGTRSAGRRFPEAVQELVFAERREESDVPVLAMYYRILWLGFGAQDERSVSRIAQLMENLRVTLQSTHAQPSAGEAKQPLGWMPPPGMKPGRMAPIRRWRNLILAAFAAVAASSLIAWIGLVLNLTDTLSSMN